jgi:hypothetical protein
MNQTNHENRRDDRGTETVWLEDPWGSTGPHGTMPYPDRDACLLDIASKITVADHEGLAEICRELADAAEARIPLGGPTAVVTTKRAPR